MENDKFNAVTNLSYDKSDKIFTEIRSTHTQEQSPQKYDILEF